jgi:NAD(P)H dehydrogenase (quinone)
VRVRIAVTGAGGRLGGQVVALLAAEDAHHVVAISRREAGLPSPPSRVSAAVADYTDLAALQAALHDVDTLVFVSSDGEGTRVLLHHENVVRAAVRSGVRHVVALSGVDADVSSPFCYAVTNGHTEQLLYESGCSVSIARASIFTEFFMRWFGQARATGEIRVPAAGGRISLVSRLDVGRCLAALAVAAPTGRHHNLTGPDSLDVATIAALAEQAWNVPVRYVDVTPTEYCVETARTGLEPWWTYAFSSMFESIREQRWAAISDEVHRLTGRPPAALRDLLAG